MVGDALGAGYFDRSGATPKLGLTNVHPLIAAGRQAGPVLTENKVIWRQAGRPARRNEMRSSLPGLYQAFVFIEHNLELSLIFTPNARGTALSGENPVKHKG